MDESPIIRDMVDTDLEQVFSLIDRENWGWEMHEIRRIYALDKRNSLVAEADGGIVSLITMINFGRTAFIVHVIVREGWRKKRLGVLMMKEAMGRLDSMDVDHVELHAMPDVIDFYNQFGFVRVEPLTFLCRHPKDCNPQDPVQDRSIRSLHIDELDELIGCQSKMMGYDEGDFRYGLDVDPPQCPVGRVVGKSFTSLLIGRKGIELNQLGPWYMNHPDLVTARSMIQFVSSYLSDRRIDVGIPSSNMLARKAFIEEGFSVMNEGIMRLVRSSRDARPFPPELLAIGHLGVI